MEVEAGTRDVATPPNKAQRETCWVAKDAYWSCLSTLGQEELCETTRKDFEKSCKKKWVEHFDRQRQFLLFKANAEKTTTAVGSAGAEAT